MSSGYQTVDIEVRGGPLRVGCWRPAAAPAGFVLAVHGITSSHRAFDLIGPQLADQHGLLVIAPDLRGRARSADLPGPWGMAGHADDLQAVVGELADDRPVLVAGHSMGGFVAVLLAARHPELVSQLVLLDGGVPLVLPDGWSLEDSVRTSLGPAAERLSMTFAQRSDYQRFWQQHPAFAGDYSDAVAGYVDYDLSPDGPPWRSGCQIDAMRTDHAQLFEGGPVDQAWPSLSVPAHLLRAPRGLQDEPGGLYQPQRLNEWQGRHARFSWQDVPDVNHYTLTLGRLGAQASTAAIATARQ